MPKNPQFTDFYKKTKKSLIILTWSTRKVITFFKKYDLLFFLLMVMKTMLNTKKAKD